MVLNTPLLNFAYIYEVWAISRILKSLENEGFELIKKKIALNKSIKEYRRRSRASFTFVKGDTEVKVIWELKFKPTFDSVYLGSLIASIEELPEEIRKIRIKPDIIITITKRNKLKKVILGDVKFRLDEKNKKLPRLSDIYKVLGYLLDLREGFEQFKNVIVEGLLIYPGRIEMLKIPIIDPKTANNVLYLNIIPLNDQNFNVEIGKLVTTDNSIT